jgi:large subunit ribosomal protein L20
MARVKRSINARKKRREVLKHASGYWGLKSKVYRRAKEQVMKSGNYAFRDRRVRKRDFRRLWIIRINAGARQHDLSYSKLMHGLKLAGIGVDRKILADLAATDPQAFGVIVEHAKSALAAKA